METTFNNIFNSAFESAQNKKAEELRAKQMQMDKFLKDMEFIKKNLESAFINTPIRVVMGMFGVQQPEYTSINIILPKSTIGSICANSCPWHCVNWDTKHEEKDLRLNGAPMTYKELIEWVAIQYSKTL